MSVDDAAAQLRSAVEARKCWSCGCFHETLGSIAAGVPPTKRSALLDAVLETGHERLLPITQDCLGCQTCWPAVAANLLADVEGVSVGPDTCAVAAIPVRAGWPPLAGDYRVLAWNAPVAICTLTDDRLATRLAERRPEGVSLVGTLHTENLGIERVLRNMLANPHLRFLLLCGHDSQQVVGHFPGGSLLALSAHGIDSRSRILNAPGRRPVLRNVEPEAVARWREAVEVVDLIGVEDDQRILSAASACAARDVGPAPPYQPAIVVESRRGWLPARTVLDSAGYFVIYVDRERSLLSLEHYLNDGLLDHIIEAETAAEVYLPACELGLLTLLEHAAYLGRELSRAEAALRSGGPYVQDAAPVAPKSCGCSSKCE